MRYDSRWVRTKPERPYRSLADFRAKLIWTSGGEKFFKEHPAKWPCLQCRGIGRIYDPNDPPCPIEGNKQRDRITCPDCGGSRCCTHTVFAEAYRKIIDKYLQEKDEYEALVKAKKIALSKLSDLERKALSELGV